MPRVIIDLDDGIVEEAMRLYGARTKAAAVRAAMEDAVKRQLRQEFADAVKSGELDLSEIIENTGPVGTRPRDGGSGAAPSTLHPTETVRLIEEIEKERS